MGTYKRPRVRIKYLVGILIFGASLLISACATIFTGTSDNISFDSELGPVRVFIDGEYIGETPISTIVNRKVGNTKPLVRFEKDGFTPQEYPLKKSFNMVAILDVTSIIVSGGIDLLTGALMEYDPLHYNIVLLPKKKDEQGAYLRKIKINFFVAATFDNLMKDLAVGQGEYLNLLPEVALTQASHKEEFRTLLANNKEELLDSANGLIFVQTLNRLIIEDPVLKENRFDLNHEGLIHYEPGKVKFFRNAG